MTSQTRPHAGSFATGGRRAPSLQLVRPAPPQRPSALRFWTVAVLLFVAWAPLMLGCIGFALLLETWERHPLRVLGVLVALCGAAVVWW